MDTDPKNLAERFAKKKKGELERRAKLKQQEEVHREKTAIEKIVIPYLRKVQERLYEISALPEDFSFGVSKLDPQDHKPLGVYFTLGGGPTIVISIQRSGSVIAEKLHKTGLRDLVYSREKKPFIETQADLTEEKIGKLIGMVIDEMPE